MTFDSLNTTPDVSNQGELVVSLSELKSALFIDFADHDARLESLITSATNQVENLTGRSLTLKSVQIIGLRDCKGQELPYAPIVGGVTIQGYSNTEGILSGGATKTFLQNPFTSFDLSYQAGYNAANVPESLREAVILCASELFTGKPTPWRKLAMPYSKIL